MEKSSQWRVPVYYDPKGEDGGKKKKKKDIFVTKLDWETEEPTQSQEGLTIVNCC